MSWVHSILSYFNKLLSLNRFKILWEKQSQSKKGNEMHGYALHKNMSLCLN